MNLKGFSGKHYKNSTFRNLFQVEQFPVKVKSFQAGEGTHNFGLSDASRPKEIQFEPDEL
ncbi:hypothetical protein L3N51_01795 [Metallosphaera sp. J1]|nr:hypothetical protein [Metallosphaera javensis (ex Hofmann et al. 2022)]BCS94167.1 MAG: hypothetical protein MjAS7_2775 [Metallosphaera javensis (ex Sakai et al. 2022)]